MSASRVSATVYIDQSPAYCLYTGTAHLPPSLYLDTHVCVATSHLTSPEQQIAAAERLLFEVARYVRELKTYHRPAEATAEDEAFDELAKRRPS